MTEELKLLQDKAAFELEMKDAYSRLFYRTALDRYFFLKQVHDKNFRALRDEIARLQLIEYNEVNGVKQL